MLMKNTTPKIIMLRHGRQKLQVNPWQILDIPDVFKLDPTYRFAVGCGALVELKEDFGPTPRLPDEVEAENAPEVPEEPVEAEPVVVKTTKKSKA